MEPVRLSVAVIMQRTMLHNRWVSERWEPIAVEPAQPTHRCVMRLPDAPAGSRWRFEGFDLELHPTEAEGYFLNISAPDPKVFVMWRMLEPEAMVPDGPLAAPFLATVSYNQAARMLDGGEQVDSVPLPMSIRSWMEPFVKEHYKPEPRRKVRRRDPLADDADPLAFNRAPRT